MHIPFVRFVKQADQVVVGAVPGSHLLVVSYIITGILERGIETGIDPQGIAPQAADIIQLFDDPVEIPDPVCVGIVKGLGINLIKNSVF